MTGQGSNGADGGQRRELSPTASPTTTATGTSRVLSLRSPSTSLASLPSSFNYSYPGLRRLGALGGDPILADQPPVPWAAPMASSSSQAPARQPWPPVSTGFAAEPAQSRQASAPRAAASTLNPGAPAWNPPAQREWNTVAVPPAGLATLNYSVGSAAVLQGGLAPLDYSGGAAAVPLAGLAPLDYSGGAAAVPGVGEQGDAPLNYSGGEIGVAPSDTRATSADGPPAETRRQRQRQRRQEGNRSGRQQGSSPCRQWSGTTGIPP